MLGRSAIAGLLMVIGGAALSFAADDQPGQQTLWSGRLGEKTKAISATDEQKQDNVANDPAKRQAEERAQANHVRREPEWLRKLDKNDRATLTGGWKLQNMSGGTQSFTTPGDRHGQYAPNTYQGRQFQQWNNVSTRQDIPSWNGSAPMFPREMWSQGYTSPNNYYGPGAQTWGGMSSGHMSPNRGAGGWTWR